MERFGRIDVLFNNAGICIHTPAEQMPFQDWMKVMDVNLNGVFLVSQAVGNAIAPAEELQGVALYLASEASSYATGAVFTIDGGYTVL